MKYALVNCDICTGKRTAYDKAIIIENNLIESLVDKPYGRTTCPKHS